VSAARKAYTIAFRAYQRLLCTKLQSNHSWWNLTRNISELSNTHNRSAPDVNSLASFFVKKTHDFDSSLSFVPLESDEVNKKTWRVKLSRVRIVMCSLDVTKAVGPDGIGPYILKYCCAELCHPVCILFHHTYM